jgi:uncharacterized protein
MNAEVTTAGPVSLADRIQFIDVLRGMALFGILAANMRAFCAPIEAYGVTKVLFAGTADLWAQGLVDTVFQGKFISIFSFLFGMGFAMQMTRAEARGARFLGFYPRRLLALALFGLIHGLLIWSGDILLTYALSGAILLLFRHRRQTTLLYWAGGLFVLPIVMSTVFLIIYYTPFRPQWMTPKPPDMAKLHAVIDIYAHGSLRQMAVQHWVDWKSQAPTALFGIYAAGLFMLGMWVWRAGIVQRLDDYKPVLRRVAAWCIPVGLAGSLFVALVKARLPVGKFSIWGWLAGVVWLPSSHILAAGYMACLALLYLQPFWRRLLQPFAAVGRMALTDYLMQSLVCTLFFYHTGTGWFGRVGPAMALIPTVVLYALQVVFSNWWLGRYRFGPMEWLWRGMTYGRFPALRRGEMGVNDGAVAAE